MDKEYTFTQQAQKESLRRFHHFVSFRNKFSLFLSSIILICYYAFMYSVGSFPDILGYRLGPSSITLGIIIGVGLIVLCIIATGLYTFVANTYFDKEQEEILSELQENNLLEPLKDGTIDYKKDLV